MPFKHLVVGSSPTGRTMKKVFIVHGWDGYPEEGWFPWLKKELEEKGFEVFVPQLPDSENPRIENWVPALAGEVGMPDENTYFVGHSLGCQTIARFLEGLPEGVKVGGAVFVGGYFNRLTLGEEENDPEIKKLADHWLSAPIDLRKVRSHLSQSVAIFSDDDYYVPPDNQDDFREDLGSEIIVESGKKHFSENDGITKLPIVLDSVLKLSKN